MIIAQNILFAFPCSSYLLCVLLNEVSGRKPSDIVIKLRITVLMYGPVLQCTHFIPNYAFSLHIHCPIRYVFACFSQVKKLFEVFYGIFSISILILAPLCLEKKLTLPSHSLHFLTSQRELKMTCSAFFYVIQYNDGIYIIIVLFTDSI